MNIAFRLLLTLNATCLLVIIFLVNKNLALGDLLPNNQILSALPNYLSFGFYSFIPVALTWLSIKLAKFLPNNNFKKGAITEIGHANNAFLPSYLGYFFVALSINEPRTLAFIYSVLFIFTFLSQALYFNPLFLLFGYRFYNIKTKNGLEAFLISKEDYKLPEEVSLPICHTINDYTFVEGETNDASDRQA